MIYSEIMKCRGCGSFKLFDFWAGGKQYIVGFPKEMSVQTSPQAPLTLTVCENCWLVQLRHTVDKDMLYKEFWYRSSMNEMMRDALKNVVDKAVQKVTLKDGDIVVDIGCNDGQLFEGYSGKNILKLGFDPATNIQSPGQQSSHGGWAFVCDYFSSQKYFEKVVLQKPAKIVTACAMFYDLEDPVTFLKDVKRILHEDGVFIVQMNYLPTMLEKNCIDNVSHEHLMYYSLTSLNNLVLRSGLSIFDVELNDVNGGSFRAYICHKGKSLPTIRAERLALEERTRLRLEDSNTYTEFSERVAGLVERFDALLVDLARTGELIYAYGASTRGTALLQLLKNTHLIKAVAERDSVKWGKLMVGSWLRIVPETAARERATVFVILPYHFLPAIVQRERHWLLGGGKFLVPVPEPVLLDKMSFVNDLELQEEPK